MAQAYVCKHFCDVVMRVMWKHLIDSCNMRKSLTICLPILNGGGCIGKGYRITGTNLIHTK